MVDHVSGLGFALGKVSLTATVVSRGNRVAYLDRFIRDVYGGHPTVAIWTIAVPDDPVALRRWLATVTNARSVVDTDAHSWPEN